MQHLLESLAQVAQTFIQHFGSFGVFLGMLLESACIPIPSEVIMPFGGFYVAQGHLSFMSVVLAGIFGNLVGSVIAYEIGRFGGRPLIDRFGRFILLSHKHLDSAEHWFARYGEWAVFFGRLLPVIRTFISLPAGIARMNRFKFILYTFLGCIPWCFLFTYIGLQLGQNWDEVRKYLHNLDYIIGALVVIGIIWFWVRFRKRGQA